jgi:hypothetical protein
MKYIFSYLGAILALLGPYFHLLALTIPDITEVPMSSVVDSDPYSAYYPDFYLIRIRIFI